MDKKLNVLIVEDEPLISIFIKKIVINMGANIIDICDNCDDAIQVLKNEKPDLIFMDINLNGPIDGINIIRSINFSYSPTIYFVSAYGDKDTIEDALSTNPYNYLIKPIKEEDIEIAVTLAKKRFLYSSKSKAQSNNQFFKFDNEYKWDKINNTLLYKDEKVDLTNYETLLLKLLIKNPNKTVTYEEIHYYVYEDSEYSLNAIFSLIKRIRKKIPKDFIKASYKKGYKLGI
ncbi:MAG: response regulator transcription factor [Halarcobacter sp.]